MIASIWAAIHNGASIAIVVSALMCLFQVYGQLCLKLLGWQSVESWSIGVATGMASTTFVGWYCFRSGVPTSFVVTAMSLIAIAILIFMAFKNSKRRRASTALEHLKVLARNGYLILIFISIFSIQAIVGFKSADRLLGTIGNNDVFNWSLVADHLLEAANIANIYPGGSSYGEWIQLVAWGTYFILALTSKISGLSALEATPYFTVFCLSLITFSIYELIQKAFNLPSIAALVVACLTGAGSFFFYIAYDGFYGQLLGTVFYLAALLTVLEKKDLTGKAALLRNVAISSVPFIGLLLVYQSGFPVFTAFASAFCAIHVVASRLCDSGPTTAPARHYWISAATLPCGALVAVATLPELALRTVRSAVEIASAPVGWPLPLISPAYLVSIPTLQPFPELPGRPYHYVVAISIVLGVHLLALSNRRRRDTGVRSAGVSLGLLFGLSLATYLLAYAVKGGAYQVWKLASYSVLPTSFTANAIIAVYLSQARSITRKTQGVILGILAICLGTYLLFIPATTKLIQFGTRACNLRAVASVLSADGIRNVVLGTPPFAETMIAFDVLSKEFRLYPLSQTYFTVPNQKLIGELDPKTSRLVMPARCGADDVSSADVNGYRIVGNGEGLLEKFYFNSDCASGAGYWGVRVLEGFSGAEPWGTWTVGSKARVEVTVPEKLRDRDVVAVFQVNPFGSQNIVVVVNDRVSRRFQLKEPGRLEINIPADAIEKGVIVFELLIDHPRPVWEVIPDSKDPRLLGLGLISLSLK